MPHRAEDSHQSHSGNQVQAGSCAPGEVLLTNCYDTYRWPPVTTECHLQCARVPCDGGGGEGGARDCREVRQQVREYAPREECSLVAGAREGCAEGCRDTVRTVCKQTAGPATRTMMECNGTLVLNNP